MTLRDAYVLGSEIGFDIGMENRSRFSSLHMEKYRSECLDIEANHYRQFSPFEVVAKEFNDSDDSDQYWYNYEEGVDTGVVRAWITV